jgi:hypothetical protein
MVGAQVAVDTSAAGNGRGIRGRARSRVLAQEPQEENRGKGAVTVLLDENENPEIP